MPVRLVAWGRARLPLFLRNTTPGVRPQNIDPGEKYNIAEEHPEVIQEIRKVLEEHLLTLEEVENQLEKR